MTRPQTTSFGLQATFFTGDEPVPCADAKCGRLVNHGDAMFRDADGCVYCDTCGQCLRYSRKKKAQRSQEREVMIREAGLED